VGAWNWFARDFHADTGVLALEGIDDRKVVRKRLAGDVDSTGGVERNGDAGIAGAAP
jgi:hypothetical protein